MGDDLQWITDEFARIEREFEGAVSFTVIRDSGFEELDALKVSFRFSGGSYFVILLARLRSSLVCFPALRSLNGIRGYPHLSLSTEHFTTFD